MSVYSLHDNFVRSLVKRNSSLFTERGEEIYFIHRIIVLSVDLETSRPLDVQTTNVGGKIVELQTLQTWTVSAATIDTNDR